MEFTIEATIALTLEYKEGMERSKHVSTDFNLKVDDKMDETKYLNRDGLPTQAGSAALSNVLVQGLVGNIHMAHQAQFRDSAEHLRWIISELERGFATVTNVYQSKFK